MNIEFEGSSLSFKKILRALYKYKWINLPIVLGTILLGLLYYYLTQPVYESTATIEIRTNPLDNRQDFFGNAIGKGHRIETEIDILKSEFLLNKTLHSINRNVDYIKKAKFKTTNLYDDSPFLVSNLKIKDKKAFKNHFIIKHVDKNRFEISTKKSFLSDIFSFLPAAIKPKDTTSFKRAVYNYGQLIDLPHCSFSIYKNGIYKRAEYGFIFNDYEAIISEIKRNFTVKPASFKSSVLRLTYKDNIAKRAKDFLNTYIQNYLLYSKRNMMRTDEKTLSFIDKQLDEVSSRLHNSEDALQKYKRSNNVTDIKEQTRQTIEKLSKFEEQLKNGQVDLNIAENIYTNVKRGNYNSISALSRKHPLLNTMIQKLTNLREEKEQKLTVFTENHPDVISLISGINELETSIMDISKGIVQKERENVYSLKRVVNEYTKRLQKLPKIEQDLLKHKRLFTVNDKVYNYLLKKQSELSIEKASIIVNKIVLDYAKEAKKRLRPKLSQILAISTFLGLVFALLHTLFRAKFDTKIKDRYDIHEATDTPIFGLIPFVKNREKYNTAYVLDEPNSAVSESFRVIKNNLEYIVTDKKCKIILITSTIPNEGKTTVSANLAAILGMGEKKSIILSLDLRRPEMHHKFKLSNKEGMSDVLSNRVDIKKVTWESEHYKNFNIVTSGAVPPNPAELLASNRMKEVLDELCNDYDYIVLDTPPFEYVSDSLALLKYADVTLFVVKSEYSDEKYIKEIDKLINRLKIKNPGIILNSVKSKHYVSKKFDYKYIYHEA